MENWKITAICCGVYYAILVVTLAVREIKKRMGGI